jgi:hypothetical protein
MDIVYFELNNWFSGRDYPNEEPFYNWINKRQFTNNEWVKDNKLVVVCGSIDMSLNYCITAPKDWVLKNCPDLLSNKSYEYKIIRYYKDEETTITETKKYEDFLRFPEEDDDVPTGRWGMHFLEYREENIGVHWEDVDD